MTDTVSTSQIPDSNGSYTESRSLYERWRNRRENSTPVFAQNYTLDNICVTQRLFNKSAIAVLLFVINRTIRFGHIGEFISQEQFIEGVYSAPDDGVEGSSPVAITPGTKLSTASLYRGIKDCEDLGVISVRRPGLNPPSNAPRFVGYCCYTFEERTIDSLAIDIRSGIL